MNNSVDVHHDCGLFPEYGMGFLYCCIVFLVSPPYRLANKYLYSYSGSLCRFDCPFSTWPCSKYRPCGACRCVGLTPLDGLMCSTWYSILQFGIFCGDVHSRELEVEKLTFSIILLVELFFTVLNRATRLLETDNSIWSGIFAILMPVYHLTFR